MVVVVWWLSCGGVLCGGSRVVVVVIRSVVWSGGGGVGLRRWWWYETDGVDGVDGRLAAVSQMRPSGYLIYELMHCIFTTVIWWNG